MQNQMFEFALFASERTHRDLRSWDKLYNWSVTDISSFWELCAEFVQIRWMKKAQKIFTPSPDGKLQGAKWFEGASLNFAENILPQPDERIVLYSIQENKKPDSINARRLYNEVAKLREFLKKQGIQKNDRVCAALCNTHHAIAAMLATTSLGAVWSSCSPDFGTEAIVDRFGQIQPKLGFFTKTYTYNGKNIDCNSTIQSVVDRIESLKTIVGIDGTGNGKGFFSYEEIVGSAESNSREKPPKIDFEETAFDHPVYILFSSGTTGVPKCIVHGAGGTLLQHKKEHMLHCDLSSADRLFFFSTCGWMMWNWMLSGLACGEELVLFDGSPRLGKEGLWDTVGEFGVTVFGTSPKFLTLSRDEGWFPKKDSAKFLALRAVLSTGSPLLPEHYQWVWDNVKSDIPIASISGGTDIVSCFMLGNPMLPIHPGEIQSAGLGMAIASFDENGKDVVGRKGELVCTQPFPSMPVGFWNDPDGALYHHAYFDVYENVWRHGDFVTISEYGGVTVHGRSDATLNPGGVRIGTSELYRCVESYPSVQDSLAISYEFQKGDPVILLFVKVKMEWEKSSEDELKAYIRKHLSARHIPHSIFVVNEIPYTRNGKKMELAAGKAVQGFEVTNLSALVNPDCLQEYFEIGKRLRVFPSPRA